MKVVHLSSLIRHRHQSIFFRWFNRFVRDRGIFTQRTQRGGGECRNDGEFGVENALRGRWRMRCARSDLLVNITLAPIEPAQVQFLSVVPIGRETPIPGPLACRR